MEVLRWGYRIPFRRTPTLSGLQSRFHPGQGAGGRSSVFAGQGSNRAGSPSLSRLLQPVIRGDESLRSVEAGHQPLTTESEGSKDILQDGDSPVSRLLLSVRAGDWMVSLDLKDAYLQVPMHPESRKFLRFVACGKVYQFKMLCFGLSTAPQVFTWVMAPVSAFLHRTGIRLRLVDPGLLPGAGPPCSGDSSSALQFVRDSRQLGEVSADANSAHGLPGSSFGLNLFQGFACPDENREASLNWRHILVLRKAACVILAGASWSAGLHDSARSGRKAADEIISVHSPEVMGSGDQTALVSCRSRMVAGSRASCSWSRSRSGVPSARLVVRRIGRGLRGHIWEKRLFPASGLQRS